MPTYDYACRACGEFEEDVVQSLAEHECGLECPSCDQPMSTVIHSVPTVGPMPSKPHRLGGTGIEIDSVEKLRAYKASNPGHRVMSKNSTEWRRHKDKAREGAERVAVGQGYRDWGQRQEQVGLANKRKKELGS